MIRAIVTDIEGTTSSISFVKDVLFPYARSHIRQYVKAHASEHEVADLLEAARSEAGLPPDTDAIIEQLERWIDEDRKVTPLKALQGLIWEAGYLDGDFRGHIYEDAVNKLREWNAKGVRLYVYSSGSVYAQKLLFAHTDFGDLTPLFSGYFDTHIGHKQDTASYATIQRELGVSPSEILFLSDIKEELDAARDEGMRTCWLVRDGEPSSQAEHTQVADFNQITL